MRAELRALTIVLGVCLAGCQPMRMNVPVLPPVGGIYTSVKMPLTTNFNATPVGKREGETRSLYIAEPLFGTSYAWGDVSIEEAAREGHIKNVSHADAGFTSVLFLFGRLTVRAYGE